MSRHKAFVDSLGGSYRIGRRAWCQQIGDGIKGYTLSAPKFGNDHIVRIPFLGSGVSLAFWIRELAFSLSFANCKVGNAIAIIIPGRGSRELLHCRNSLLDLARRRDYSRISTDIDQTSSGDIVARPNTHALREPIRLPRLVSL